ncbi:cysteine protease atg4da-like isoform X1 [Myxocyprinus asiaticus]|uniref:cysteine protease atg4da-like isoform X1 n=1 Tax=Myxocyprinus asiaticus TaxID=70543 RepID=UPI002223939A|nr:cysteine protease atg4da-like isoform X1 [Myxocyprinus asiaticus]XP_051569424.1 cysteine protease atg4da-like isoform X1 [Myxocyprinus asiaticus]
MDVSDECSIEGDPTEDLASFEVVDLSNHGLLDLSEELNGHERKEKAKLKTKLISAWNNVKYGGWTLKTKSHLRKSSPLYVLGQSYQLSYSGERECLRRAFSSLLWLTYRRGFPPLDGSALTSDAGWGCMLRSAQMLLAQGLMLHMMPTGWTWPATHHQTKDDLEVVDPRVLDDLFRENRSVSGKPHRRSLDTMLDSKIHEDRTHRKLVSWFGDLPSAPFGLHRLVDLGKASGKRAGDWYGPSIAAHILQKAVAASEVSNLVVYVAQDCTVYVGDVLRLCGMSRTEDLSLSCRSVWKSLILLVPIRLGGDVLNPTYTKCVKRLLALRCCIGIIGGKPKHSLYFVGFQDDQLIYLDPHYCQSAVDITQDNFPLESFHCKTVRKMSFNHMDPSCTLGFYASSRADFQNLYSDVTTALTSSEEKYPIFTFVDGHDKGERVFSSASVSHINTKDRRSRTKQRNNTEEFVLL